MSVDRRDREIRQLKAKNERLRQQFTTLLDSYSKLEVSDLEHNLQVTNQKRLIDFIHRVAGRLDDDDLVDVMVEEFLIELGADRVSYILPGSGPSRRFAVANEAVEKNIKRLALPYFISPESDGRYLQMLEKCLEGESLVSEQWETPVHLRSDASFQLPMEHNFQQAMEKEFNVVHKVDLHCAMAACIQTTAGGKAIICLQRTGARRMWSKAQGNLFGDMCRYATMLLEQTQMTQQIRDLKDQLSSLISSMPSAIVGMDLLGTVTMWGGRAEEFFEMTADQALGKVFWQVVPQYQFVSNAMMEVMGLEGDRSMEYEELPYRRRDASVLYHHVSLFTMFGNDRGEIALRVDDVTKQVELNHQLFHAQRMEVVGTLAGGLAHDMNNVLGGIVGTLSLLKKRTRSWLETGEAAGRDRAQLDIEDIEIVESCATRASEMVKRLLALSHKRDIKMQPLDLRGLVKSVAALCGASFDEKIKVEHSLPRQEVLIRGDRTQLEQVILNICVNARDAMKEGGSLRLALSVFKVNKTFRKAHPEVKAGTLARISITDTGPGIPLGDQDRIFDPFFTTKSHEQGTGLGLSIVDNLMKAHQGLVELDSETGKGTTFHLYFQTVAAGSEAVPREVAAPPKPADVLVVDSDEMMRKTVSRILYELGYAVATAGSGATALKMSDGGLRFDLFIIGMDMPIMNGADTARLLRERLPEARVLFCAGQQHRHELQDLLEAPRTWALFRPFGFEDVRRVIRIALGDGDA